MRRNPSLTAFSLCQLALFAPIAWWANKHPQPTSELAVTHALPGTYLLSGGWFSLCLQYYLSLQG